MATVTTYSRPGGGTVTFDWTQPDFTDATLTVTESGVAHPKTFAMTLFSTGAGSVGLGTAVVGTPTGDAQKAIDIPIRNSDGVLRTMTVQFIVDRSLVSMYPLVSGSIADVYVVDGTKIVTISQLSLTRA